MFDFLGGLDLTPAVLREVSQHQIGVLAAAFDGLGLDPAVIDRDRSAPLSETGGFLALRSPRAGPLTAALHAHGVMVDARGEVLRFGPAPYLSDTQLRDAIAALGEALRT